MNFLESKVEQVGGIILGAFSLIVYFIIIPAEITEVRRFGVSPRFMPELVCVLLFAAAVCVFANGYKNRNNVKQKIYKISPTESKLVLKSLLLITLYILAFDLVGYMIPTIAALAVFMYIYGQRNKKLIFLISLGLPVLIYVFFTKVLQMPLP
jgi:glycosyltransferase involved in cell wall biosynthesis